MATRKPMTGPAGEQEAVGMGPVDGADGPTGGSGSYEAARDALAGIVSALEAGGLSLEESLALWERGERLAAECERWLAGARERLERDHAAAPDPRPA